jgi:hypothetical protein
MKRTKSYSIWPKSIRFETGISSLISDFAPKRKLALNQRRTSLRANDTPYSSFRTDEPDEFCKALSKIDHPSWVFLTLCFDGSEPHSEITVEIEFSPDQIKVSVESSNDDLVVATHHYIATHWRLEHPPVPLREEGRPLLQPTLFLGRHFDEAGKAAAEKLARFLRLLRLRVEEADEYRAGPIPEKVKNKIASQSIYLGLVTSKREHDWITAESAFALGCHHHVIFAVEEGSEFNPTVHGRDREVIRFAPGRIEETFLELLEEFWSLGMGR